MLEHYDLEENDLKDIVGELEFYEKQKLHIALLEFMLRKVVEESDKHDIEDFEEVI